MTIRNIYIVSLIIYLIAAFFSIGYHHPDEHHKLLEFAGLKLGINEAGDLPWEFQNKMRPTLQVYLVVWIYSVFKLIGLSSPFLISTILRLLSAAISFLAVHLFISAFRPKIESEKLQTLFILLSFLLWFNVYNNVRFSSENWSGTFFLIGFSLMHLKNRIKIKHFFIVGLLFGFSFVFRFQMGLLIFGLVVWLLFIKRENFGKISMLLFGVASIITIGIVADYYFYEQWTFSLINYWHQNIFLDKASGFGVEPWWFYLTSSFIAGIPPFSLIFIFAFIGVFIYKPKSELTWTFLPFIFIHCLVAHKEIRFLFPILGFVPLFIIESLEIIQNKILNKDISENKYYRIIKNSFLVVNFVALAIIAFKPAESNVRLYHAIYKMYDKPATLFSLEDNPYIGTTNINFYKRQNLDIIRISEYDEINQYPGEVKLIVTHDRDLINELDQSQKIVYTALPVWVKNFNVNNWVERTKFWKVYEINTEFDKN